MKTAFLYVLLCLSTFAFKTHAEWYKHETAEFVIEFPQQPELSSQKVATAVGELEMKIASYEPTEDENNMAFLFISTIYPDSVINSGMTEKLEGFFRRSIDGAVRNVNGKLLSEKAITIGKFPGREVKIDYESGEAVILVHVYLVNNNMYFVETISQTDHEENDNALRFHRSFKLKK